MRFSIASGIKALLLVIPIHFFTVPVNANPTEGKAIEFSKNGLVIVLSDKEEGAIKIAVSALIRDFREVMEFEPEIHSQMNDRDDETELVIVNRASGLLSVPQDKALELDGFRISSPLRRY